MLLVELAEHRLMFVNALMIISYYFACIFMKKGMIRV